jgi:hypothetical protein
MATWMAEVRSTARRLEAELHRTDYDRMNSGQQADYVAICHAIDTAKRCAEWSPPRPAGQHLASVRQLWRRTVSWWTGGEIDLAYSALHTAGQILLSVEQEDAVKAHIPDMAVAVAADFRPSDLRVRGYLKTLEILAHPDRRIGDSDRAQLRAIRQACDSAEASAHCAARTFRNTLVVMGALLTALLAGVAGLGWADQSFRAVFAAAGEMPRPSGWYVPELEVIASLSGLASAALAADLRLWAVPVHPPDRPASQGHAQLRGLPQRSWRDPADTRLRREARLRHRRRRAGALTCRRLAQVMVTPPSTARVWPVT